MNSQLMEKTLTKTYPLEMPHVRCLLKSAVVWVRNYIRQGIRAKASSPDERLHHLSAAYYLHHLP